MRTSPAGIEHLISFEGEILEVYLDPAGLPTLGVGHLLTPAERRRYPVGTPISRDLSRDFLDKDLKRFEDGVAGLVTVPLTQNQFDALVSLAFNIGLAAFGRSTVLRKLNKKDYRAAADAFLMWKKIRDPETGQLKTLPGLLRRRNAEREMFLRDSSQGSTGEEGAPATPPEPDRSVSEVATEIAQEAKKWIDEAADIETRTQRSAAATKVVKAAPRVARGVGELFLLFFSFYNEYWYVTLPLTALAIACLYLYLRRRRRLKDEEGVVG